MFHRPDAPAAFEELFLYACPKFVSANGPPYEDADAVDRLIAANTDGDSSNISSQSDCTRRHLDLFLTDVAAQQSVPTLRSFLKLYTSLGTRKLSNFLDTDEEELVQEMMVLKQTSRSISRVAGSEGVGLLEGQTITTSDLNFIIDEVKPFVFEPRVTFNRPFIGHGSYRGIYSRQTICRVVHQEY